MGGVHTRVSTHTDRSGVACRLTGVMAACSSLTSPTLTHSCWSEVRGQAVWAGLSPALCGRGRHLLSHGDAVLQVGQQEVWTSSLSLTGGVKLLEHIQEVE